MKNRLIYIDELNGAMLLLWLAGYHFNDTRIAGTALAGVILGLAVNVFHCFSLGKISEKEEKVQSLHRVVAQMVMSVGLIVLYFIARW